MKTSDKRLRAVVAERGQVTIPKAVRDQLGIVAGTILLFEFKGGKIIATREKLEDPVSSVYGCLKGRTPYQKTDKYVNEIRGAAE